MAKISVLFQRIKQFLSAKSIFSKLFALFSVLFFFVGIFTIGTLNGTGDHITLPADQSITVAFELKGESGQELKDVYVNIGTVYATAGSLDSDSRVRTSVEIETDDGSTVQVGTYADVYNVYTESVSTYAHSGANFNWLEFEVTSTRDAQGLCVLVHFNPSGSGAAATVNEVAFYDEDGKSIRASILSSKSSQIAFTNTDGTKIEQTLSNVIDRYGVSVNSSSHRTTFSQGEIYLLESVRGMEQGSFAPDVSAYPVSTQFNSLAIAVLWLFTRIFGLSTFGLRLPAFLACFAICLMAYCFGKKLFKSEKWGFVAFAIALTGGVSFTLWASASPVVMALAFALASIFLAYRFFADGIDGKRPVVSGLNVLFAGVCYGVALAIYTPSIFSAAVSLPLLVFGIRRMFQANEYALAKIDKNYGEIPAKDKETAERKEADVKKQQSTHDYSVKVVGVFAAAAYIFIPVMLLMLFNVCTYSSFVKVCIAAGQQSKGYFMDSLIAGLKGGFGLDATAYTAGGITAFSWLVGVQSIVAFFGNGEALNATFIANIPLCVAALVAFVYTTVKVFRDVTATPASAEERKMQNTTRRAYLISFGGAWLIFIVSLFLTVTAEQSVIFNFFYTSFIVTALYRLSQRKGKGKLSIADKLSIVLAVVAVLWTVASIVVLAVNGYWG